MDLREDDKMKTPVFDKLKLLVEEDSISFHTPGHKKKNSLINWGKYLPMLDTTEIQGTDNLMEPRGIIKESQEYASRVFGSKSTYYTVNGSTGSIYISLSAISNPGDKVLVQRNSHKAVYNGMILNRLNPVYIYPNYNEKHSIFTGIDPEDIEEALERDKEIKIVLLSYPDYYGICSDLERIGEIVHRHGRILMVDEAHGSHFKFSKDLPKTALQCGGDIVVQSTHKTLPSFTQTSMIHVGGERVEENKLRERLELYTTSSPSYIFLASCELAAAYMDSKEGVLRLKDNILRARETIDRLNKIEGVFAFSGDPEDKTIHGLDPTKILFSLEGMRGTDIERELYEKHNIRLEMSDAYYGLALSSLMNEDSDYEALVQAVEDLVSTGGESKKELESIKIPKAEISMPIYQAYYSQKKQVDLEDSIGEISAGSIIPYPPGIPILVPGEVITLSLFESIMFLMGNNIEILGLMGYNKDKVDVVDKGE